MADTELQSPIEEIVERAIAYRYTDVFMEGSPFPVYEADVRAWWMDGGIKLNELIRHLKLRRTVVMACYRTGISYEQYYHFKQLHPWFIPLIKVYRQVLPQDLQDVIISAALGTKEVRDTTGKIITPAVAPNAKIALGAARLLPNIEKDPDFAEVVPGLIPLGGSSTTLVAQEIKDADGKVVMSKRALEITQSHDRNNGDSTG